MRAEADASRGHMVHGGALADLMSASGRKQTCSMRWRMSAY